MKKLAIFVEGQTEQIFIKKLITEIAGKHNIAIELAIARGGKTNNRNIIILESISKDKDYYIQLVDSGNDERVLSDVRDNLPNLKLFGFEKVLGIRDVYPEKREDLKKFLKFSKLLNKDVDIPVKIIFAVMEIETWFLKEYSYLEKVDPRLVKEFILNQLGYDLENENLEDDAKYFHPAEVLDEIYKLVGRRYDKKKKKIDTLVNCLDYELFYLKISKKLKSLNLLVEELDTFLE